MPKPKYTSIRDDDNNNNNKGHDFAREAELDGGWLSDLSEWMTNLPLPLHDTPLNKLAIPGSHDSGAYHFDPNLPIAPDESDFIKMAGKCFKKVVYRWSQTQHLNIKEQLENGIRYLDMRSAYLESEDDYFFVHGLYGPKISDLLHQVNGFLNAHPKEVVILDFNHNYFDEKALGGRFAKMVESILGDKMYPIFGNGDEDANGVLTISLHDIRKFNKQVLALYSDDTHKGRSSFWPEKYISSTWFNTDDDKTLVKDLNERLNDCKDSTFNVFQGILSPQNMTIALNLTSSLEKVLGAKADRAVSGWLQSVYDSKRFGVNIVICDFVGKNDLPRYVLRLNEIRGDEKGGKK